MSDQQLSARQFQRAAADFRKSGWQPLRPSPDEESPAEAEAPVNNKNFFVWVGGMSLKMLPLFLLLAFLGDICMYVFPTSAFGYHCKYGVPSANVTIERQPHNCEWGSAPLGEKHCHYDKSISTVRVQNSSDGKFSYISYDEGKTWNDNAAKIEPSVWVSWTKVEE